MAKFLGREFSLSRKPKEKIVKKETSRPQKVEAYINRRAQEAGLSEQQALEELFSDGWLTFTVEESGAIGHIDASQMFLNAEKIDPADEYRRLREKFGPVSTCVDYIRDQIIGGGVEASIDNPKNANQRKAKNDIDKLIEDIYQDEYSRSLHLILPLLVDQALTYGASAAEVVYEEDINFWDYASVSEESQIMKVENQRVEIANYDVRNPEWKNLKRVTRLKVVERAMQTMQLQRNPKTWEAKYWVIDEGAKQDDYIKLSNGMKIRKKKSAKPTGSYFHIWQMFWLILNRKDWSEKGRSIIEPAMESARLLEKIMKAVGEGIHRAGNKKYFIVCGTEKRPWSGPHIRNVLQQLKEASAKNWSTIPMPAGFSIEEIGGEVFEAPNVVSYFKSTIAKAMHVPASELGVEVKDEKEYSYDLMRLYLKMALKHQIFKRHLWAMYGDKQTKQGGTETDTYIPNARIRTEALLSMREQVDLFIDTMNQANPTHPLVKLKTEMEYCKLMGWEDVIEYLPTLKEFSKELEDAKKMQAKMLKEKSKPPVGVIKAQGDPKAASEEQQKKRLEGMQEKTEEGKGLAREQGGTRIPKEIQESLIDTPDLGTRRKNKRR